MKGRYEQMGETRLVNDYLEEARKNTPLWLKNKVFKCIYCGYQPIYLNNDLCPFGKENQKEENTFSSITIGIAILRKLELLHKGERVDSKNEDLKRELFESIQETCKTLPLKDFEYILSKKEDLIDFYCSQHNYELKPISQQIKKISVRKLFGYNSYDLDFNNDLSIIYGSNALGKTTVFKLFEYIFLRPKINSDLESKDESKDTPFEKNEKLALDYCESMSILDKEIHHRLEYLFNIPFESFEATFTNGFQIKVSKGKDEHGRESLFFDCPSRGFDSIQHFITIAKSEIDNGRDSLAIRNMLKHYDNIRQLFPNINNVSKFLTVQADRNNNVLSLIEALPKADRRRFFKKVNPHLIAKNNETDLIFHFKEFNEQQKHLFSLAFFSEIKSKLAFLNIYFGRCNNNSRERVLFRWSQIEDYFNKHANSHFYKVLNERTDEILASPECITYPKTNDNFKENIRETVSQFFDPTKENNNEGIQKTLDYLFDSPAFAENYHYMKNEINDLFDFYKRFESLKSLFENIYFENDPARKQLCINKFDKLCIKANTGLDFDFKTELSPWDLSTGEINILTLLYRLVFETTCDSIVLIDEPEISLHVEWQEQISSVIEKIMGMNPGMQVIIASHSPFIGADKDPECFVNATLIEEKRKRR